MNVPTVEYPVEIINPCQLHDVKLTVGDEFVLLTKPPILPLVQFKVNPAVAITYVTYTKPP